MRDEDLAWAAGFFDGEGHVGAYGVDSKRQKNNCRLLVDVAQVRLEPLMRFQSITGLGRIGPPQGKSGCHHLKVTSQSGVHALYDMLKPWLSVPKLEQFATAFEKWEGREGKWRRDPTTKRKVG